MAATRILLAAGPCGLLGRDLTLLGYEVRLLLEPRDRAQLAGIDLLLLCGGHDDFADADCPRLVIPDGLCRRIETGDPLALAELVQLIERGQRALPAPEGLGPLIASFADVLVLLDAELRPRYISPSIERITGFTPADLLQNNRLSDMVHPEDLPVLRDAIDACLAHPLEPRRFEFRQTALDAGYVRLEAIAQNLLGVPGVESFILVMRDMAFREQSQDLIQASEQRFRIMAEQTGQMVYDWDVATGRIHWAGAIEQITGFDPEAYQDVDIHRWEAMIHAEDRPAAMKTLERAAASDGRYMVEYRHQRSDGSFVYVEDSGVFLKDERGVPYRMLGSMKDISERMRASQALQAALHEREILLQEIHHRVKNNFQVIISLLNLQIRKLPERSAAGQLIEARNRIRSLALVHEKLYQLPSMASIDLADYLTLLARELLAARGQDAVKVALLLELDPVSVQVEQAIPCGLLVNELLTNAFKYAFEPERQSPAQVTLGVHDSGERIQLIVADNGVGLPAAADQRSLGLQLVRQLVRQLHGQLEHEDGPGTRWLIDFPKRSATEA